VIETQPKPASSQGACRFWRILPLAVGAVFATGIPESFAFDTFFRCQVCLQDLGATRSLTMVGLCGMIYGLATQFVMLRASRLFDRFQCQEPVDAPVDDRSCYFGNLGSCPDRT
jgi:hypothetical protein